MTWRDRVSAFVEAGRAAVALLSTPEVAAAWRAPSVLEGYTVGGLANHLEIAVGLLPAALDAPEPDGPTCRLVEFYAADPPEGFYDAVRAGAERRGHGPEDVAAAMQATVDDAAARLPAEDPGRAVPVLLGPGTPARLDDYVSTRIVELVVHGDDLAASAGIGFEPPTAAAQEVAAVLVDMAMARSGAAAVLRAFTRAERSDPAVLHVFS